MIFIFQMLVSVFSVNAQVGSVADAMGGAGIAAGHPVESAFLNPAGLSDFSHMYFGGQYFFGKTILGDMKQWGATIADASPENLFQGSLSYRDRSFKAVGGDVDEKEIVATLSGKIHAAIGIGAHVYKRQTDTFLGNTDQYNGDLGVQWRMAEAWTFGLTQFGVTGPKQMPVAATAPVNRTVAGVMWMPLSYIAVLGDVIFYNQNNPDHRTAHAVGASFSNSEYVHLRFGGRFDDVRGETYYTAGLMFDGLRLKIGYSYQKEVRRELGEMHTIDFSLNL